MAIRWVFPQPDGPITLFDAPRMLLGRGEECRTRLSGDDVSRYHAEITAGGEGFLIQDLKSTNGVCINGERLSEALLHEGDVLRLGSWVGVVVTAERAVGTAPEVFSEPARGLFAGPVLRHAVEMARAAATTDLPVVIEGETGTGKERFARAIHAWSGRTGGFVAINCAALPENLAEAELFGYRKGAFTGADRSSLGHFRAAEDGTLLLDEIVELPLPLQAKVLRVIEQKEVVPLGETRPVPLRVRWLAAAQQPLQQAVDNKRFRADLLARLDGVNIRLPPIRDRIEEVPFLFLNLAERYAEGAVSVDARLIERLCLYDWPFNAREIDLLARKLVALHGKEPKLLREHLPERYLERVRTSGKASVTAPDSDCIQPGPRRDKRSAPEDDERDYTRLVEALRKHQGNVSRAAADAGVSRPRAYRLMRAHPPLDLRGMRGSGER
jgi:transcriptional regulator with PAS, ATPase and Fis domain